MEAAVRQSVTRGFARGAAIGALVLTGFGGFWAIESVVHQSEAPAWEWVAVGVTGAVLASLCLLRMVRAANLAEAHDPGLAARAGRRMGMSFGIIFGIEGLLIGAAAAALAQAGRPLLIPVAIALIVGLHFFPLARVFRVPVYHLTGSLRRCGAGVAARPGRPREAGHPGLCDDGSPVDQRGRRSRAAHGPRFTTLRECRRIGRAPAGTRARNLQRYRRNDGRPDDLPRHGLVDAAGLLVTR